MAIADQITRIRNAKAAIKASIEAKGVTVGSGRIDTYAAKIDQIQTGGGDENFIAMIERSATSFDIPDGVTKIAPYAFYNYNALAAITIPNTVKSIGNYAFGTTGLTSVVIPEGITDISPSSFSYCSHLASVSLPSTLTSLSSAAFRGCTALTAITIPENVTTMAATSLYIGSASSKATLTMKPTTPPTITSATLGDNISKIIVPAASLQAYKTAQYWSAYADIIESDGPIARYFITNIAEASSLNADVTFKSNGVTYTHIELAENNTQLVYSGGNSISDLIACTWSDESGTQWSSLSYCYIDVYSDPNDVMDSWVSHLKDNAAGYKIYETWYLQSAGIQIPQDSEGNLIVRQVEFLSGSRHFAYIGRQGGMQDKLYYDDGNIGENSYLEVYTADKNTWLFPSYRILDFVQDIHDDEAHDFTELREWLNNYGTQVTMPTYGNFTINETPTIDEDMATFVTFEAQGVEYNNFYRSLPENIDYQWENFEGPSINAYAATWSDDALRSVTFKQPPMQLYNWLRNNATWVGKE